jgi:uncharacterized protein YutE (UPF0331/DUF86 family)
LENNATNELEKRGIFYTVQTVIEAIIDLVAMLVKDLGIEVKDDSSNIDAFAQHQKINLVLWSQLKQANSMRNLLVLRYNGVEEQKITSSIAELKEIITNCVKIIERCVDEGSKINKNTK